MSRSGLNFIRFFFGVGAGINKIKYNKRIMIQDLFEKLNCVMNVTVPLVLMKDLYLRTVTSCSQRLVQHTWSTGNAFVICSSFIS